MHTIDRCLQIGLKEIDFSRGNELYKYRFTNKSSNNFGIVIHKNIVSLKLSNFYNKIKEAVIKNRDLHNFIIKYKNKVLKIFSKFVTK